MCGPVILFVGMEKSPGSGRVKISRAMFISEPYLVCPKCQNKTFGVLSIYDKRYIRECKTCWHHEDIKLPAIIKKIVYIDQFALSEMMKALHEGPGSEGQKRKKWFEFFERLDRARKLQLIVCPISTSHQYESLMWKGADGVKRMYEHLSGDGDFQDFNTIRRYQIHDAGIAWIEKPDSDSLVNNISSRDVLMKNIDKWEENFHISVNVRYPESFVDDLRTTRDDVKSGLGTVFARWKTEKGRKYADWFQEEVLGFGKMTVESARRRIAKIQETALGTISATDIELEDLWPDIGSEYMGSLRMAFRETGISESECGSKVLEFLVSFQAMARIPFVRLQAGMYAVMARRAVNGHGKEPGPGMANDINAASTLIPYCDAMFLDREFRGILSEKPLSEEVTLYGTKIFSAGNMQEFYSYLDELEAAMSDEHRTALRALYSGGDDPEPYVTMYEEEDKDN